MKIEGVELFITIMNIIVIIIEVGYYCYIVGIRTGNQMNDIVCGKLWYTLIEYNDDKRREWVTNEDLDYFIEEGILYKIIKEIKA